MLMSVANIALSGFTLFKRYKEKGASGLMNIDSIKQMIFLFLYMGVLFTFGIPFDAEKGQELKDSPFVQVWDKIKIWLLVLYGFMALLPLMSFIPVVGMIGTPLWLLLTPIHLGLGQVL